MEPEYTDLTKTVDRMAGLRKERDIQASVFPWIVAMLLTYIIVRSLITFL